MKRERWFGLNHRQWSLLQYHVSVCSLGNSFDRITEDVQNVCSLRSHVASEGVDRVWLHVPNDGESSPPSAATGGRSESVHERSHPGALSERSWSSGWWQRCRNRPGHWRGLLEEKGARGGVPAPQNPYKGHLCSQVFAFTVQGGKPWQWCGFWCRSADRKALLERKWFYRIK